MSPPDLDPGSDAAAPSHSPGVLLLAERRNQGLSLGDIARQLKLSVRQVEALEHDEYDSFQGTVFVRGFLRNYARLLGLDPDRLLEAAGAAAAPAVVRAAPSAPEQRVAPNPERRLRVLSWGGFAALAALVVILLASNASKEQQRAGHMVRESSTSTAPAVAALPPAESAAPAEQASEGSAQGPGTSAAPAAQRKPAAPADSPSGGVAGAQPAESGAASAARPPASDLPRTESSPPEESAAPASPKILVVGTGPGRIRMIFADESWVEVRDGSGTTIFSRLNAPGTERVVRGLPPFDVVVGNAHRVKLLYEDKPIDLGPHTRVDVARITLE